MKIYEFNKYFPDEAACRRRFREWRDEEGAWGVRYFINATASLRAGFLLSLVFRKLFVSLHRDSESAQNH